MAFSNSLAIILKFQTVFSLCTHQNVPTVVLKHVSFSFWWLETVNDLVFPEDPLCKVLNCRPIRFLLLVLDTTTSFFAPALLLQLYEKLLGKNGFFLSQSWIKFPIDTLECWTHRYNPTVYVLYVCLRAYLLLSIILHVAWPKRKNNAQNIQPPYQNIQLSSTYISTI